MDIRLALLPFLPPVTFREQLARTLLNDTFTRLKGTSSNDDPEKVQGFMSSMVYHDD